MLLLKLLLNFGFSGTSWVSTEFKTELQHHFKFPLNFGLKPSFNLKPKLRTKFLRKSHSVLYHIVYAHASRR